MKQFLLNKKSQRNDFFNWSYFILAKKFYHSVIYLNVFKNIMKFLNFLIKTLKFLLIKHLIN